MRYMEELLKSKEKKIQGLQNQVEQQAAQITAQNDPDNPNLDLLSKQNLMDKVSDLLQKNAQQQKSLTSYQSAIETLTQKWKEDKKDRKAKESIVEAYLSQVKKDKEIEIENLNGRIITLESDLIDISTFKQSLELKVREQETLFSTAEGRQKYAFDKIKKLEKDNTAMAANILSLQEQIQNERKEHYQECEAIRVKIFDECA